MLVFMGKQGGAPELAALRARFFIRLLDFSPGKNKRKDREQISVRGRLSN